MKKKTIISLLMVLFMFITNISAVYSHSGRTDANGGHRDNKNKSGLGSYHYHCGGYPAHLHSDGVCPYKASSKASKSGSASTKSASNSNSSTKTNSSAQKTADIDVKAIQKRLDELGYDCGPVDGIMGPKTKAAIKKFQKDNGLKADGIVGPKTKKALGL